MFNILCKTRPCHGIPDSLQSFVFLSVPDEVNIHGTRTVLFVVSLILMNVDLVCYLCRKEDHTLQYAVLSNEIGLSPFLLILAP
jgi:hypothetical protein